MTGRIAGALLALVLGGMASGPAAAQRVDLAGLDATMPGPATQVLVLGSVHLSHGGPADGVAPVALAPVLDRLAAFRPEVITIEALSGETCVLIRQRAAYRDVRDYCPDVTAARAATGLDVLPALDAIDAALADWPARPSPAQRRHLAALFLAAGEPVSALVQWWQLDAAERRAGDGLDAALVDLLRKRETSPNENYQVAARLAARLGLQRLHAVDDHLGDSLAIPDTPAFEAAIRAAWDGADEDARRARLQVETLQRSGDFLATYRAVNDPAYLRRAIASDFGQALRDPSPQRFGRQYVGGWEARNLHMVANLRAAFREHPGTRVLAVVGASHKPWFDALLGMMQGVEVVDAARVLR